MPAGLALPAWLTLPCPVPMFGVTPTAVEQQHLAPAATVSPAATRMSLPLPGPAPGARCVLPARKRTLLEGKVSSPLLVLEKKKQEGMAFAAQQGAGRIKDLLLAKAGSFLSGPKDLTGLQTLKKNIK